MRQAHILHLPFNATFGHCCWHRHELAGLRHITQHSQVGSRCKSCLCGYLDWLYGCAMSRLRLGESSPGCPSKTTLHDQHWSRSAKHDFRTRQRIASEYFRAKQCVYLRAGSVRSLGGFKGECLLSVASWATRSVLYITFAGRIDGGRCCLPYTQRSFSGLVAL